MNELQYKMNFFPLNTLGKIIGFDESLENIPIKIIEMGLFPDVSFRILYEAPFGGPLYIEFGRENTRLVLRKEEAELILVEKKKMSRF